jgi:hypothetical protein
MTISLLVGLVFLRTNYFHDINLGKVILISLAAISVLAGTYEWLRAKINPAGHWQEVMQMNSFALPLTIFSFIVCSILVATSQWFGANAIQAGFGLVMLFAFAANRLPADGLQTFRRRLFKQWYAPCLLVAVLGYIFGLLHNAT